MQDFLGDFICSDCFPVDTQFVFIDACWNASEAHADVQHGHDLAWMQRYAEYAIVADGHEAGKYRNKKAVNIPVFARGTFDTVHSQDPGHHRKPVSLL